MQKYQNRLLYPFPNLLAESITIFPAGTKPSPKYIREALLTGTVTFCRLRYKVQVAMVIARPTGYCCYTDHALLNLHSIWNRFFNTGFILSPVFIILSTVTSILHELTPSNIGVFSNK
jgi:hypothetical protein